MKGLVTGEQLQQVEEQMVALDKQVEARQAELEWQSRLEQDNFVVELQQVEERLREVQERTDMTERIESIEKSMQVCVNSVRVLHSYVEAKGSSDSDRDDT